MNTALIAVNVLVFAARFLPGRPGMAAKLFVSSGALYAPLLFRGQGFYRLFTSIFLHADPAHLFNNMIVQFAGGSIVERNLGHFCYFAVYLLCGTGGNAASVLMDYVTGNYGFSIGASGAVFGIIGVLLYLMLREKDKRLLLRAAVMAFFMLYGGWGNPAVNQAAHIGGLLCGFLLAALLLRNTRADLSGL